VKAMAPSGQAAAQAPQKRHLPRSMRAPEASPPLSRATAPTGQAVSHSRQPRPHFPAAISGLPRKRSGMGGGSPEGNFMVRCFC